MASGPALMAEAKTRIDDTGDRETIVCELAESGDPVALTVMDREGYYLGLGLANLVTNFCPDMIALGGGVMQSSHLFLNRARQVVRQCCTMVPFERAEIAVASLGADTALVGAAQAWHHRFSPTRKIHEL